MAKFIQVVKEHDGKRTAVNADEIKTITEFEKTAGSEKTTKCVRIEIRGGYSLDVKTSYEIIMQQILEAE